MNPTLRQIMEEFVREYVGSIPALFGRIAYLSSLFDAGRYRQAGLETRLGASRANAVLSKIHCDLVIAWLQLTMQERYDDLRQHLTNEGEKLGPKQWLESSSVADLLPRELGLADRELFVSELRILFEILRRGGAT
jgi:hypothetical protein